MSLSISNVSSAFSQFTNLNLSSSQQSQIQSILQSAQSQGESLSQVKGQIQGVLTPTQQQTLQSDLASRKALHSGRHHQSGDGGSSGTTDVLSPDYSEQSAAVQDLQNQAIASQAITQSQLQTTLLQFGTAYS
jgi:hypothetical protein